MKQMIALLLIALLLAGAVPVFAQRKAAAPAEGFWVVESNKKMPRNCVVYFYASDQVLIHRQTITGKRMNPQRRRVAMQLNGMLNEALVAWKKKEEEKGWAVRQ